MKEKIQESVPVFDGMAQVVKEKQKKGFACISPERRKEIASKGGKSISANKEYMSQIGKKGGINSGIVRQNKN